MSCAPHSGISVLIVDDDKMVARSVGRLLTAVGHGFEVQPSAQAALTRLDAQHFDLILCDLIMPGIDGLQFIQRARRANLQTPIILITGGARPRDIVSAHRLGAVDCLLKPFDEVELKTVIDRVLALGPSTDGERVAELLGASDRLEASARQTGQAAPQVASHASPALDGSASASAAASPTPSRDGAALSPGSARSAGLQSKLERYIKDEPLDVLIPPVVLSRMIALSESAAADEDEVVEVLDSSAIVAAAVMQASRRADVARGSAPVRTLHDAMIRLGTTRALRHALTVASRATGHELLRGHPEIVNSLWVHHLISARAAEHLAHALTPNIAAGMHGLVLFMEMGELLVYRALAHIAPQMLAPGTDPAAAVEWVALLHGEAGRAALHRWELPAIYSKVALDHTHETALSVPATPSQQTLVVLRAARQIATHVPPGSPYSAGHKMTPLEFNGLPGLEPKLLRRIAAVALDDVKSTLGMDAPHGA